MNTKRTARVVLLALVGISVLFLGYFSSFANAAPCEPLLTIKAASTTGVIAQGNNVSLQVSVLNEKTSPITGYELQMPAGIDALTFTPTSIPFNITASTLRTFDFNVTVNTNTGDYELVFLLYRTGAVCNYVIYHFIVAREHFTPGIFNITEYNEILLNITINNENNIDNDVFLNLSRIDHVLKIMAAGILVSVGIWGMFNAHPIWIVEDRERRLHHHFKRGLALVSAAVAEILFSSYLFAAIMPPLLTSVQYGNEIYGLLCAGTALFAMLGIDRAKYRGTAGIFFASVLLCSSLMVAFAFGIVAVTTTAIFLLRRAARQAGQTAKPPRQPFLKFRFSSGSGIKPHNKVVYEI